MLPHDTPGWTACASDMYTHHAAPCKLDGSAAAAAGAAAATTPSTAAAAAPAGGGGDELVDVLLSADGNYVQELLLEEAAKLADAAVRESLG